MKNSKPANIFLVIALLGIWGWVIYTFFRGRNIDLTSNFTIDNSIKVESNSAQLDTFSLIAAYRDPFVIKYVSINLAEDLNLEEENNKEKLKPIVTWPQIKYGGSVKNKATNRNIALVNIDDRNLLLGIGDTASEVRITAIYPDSVVVLYKKEIKAISKSKTPISTNNSETTTPTLGGKKKNK